MFGHHPDGLPDWANLAVLHRNTLPPRSRFVVFSTEQDALSRNIDRAKSLCLSGDWRFHLANSPFEAPDGFQLSTFDRVSWGHISVPGMWQLQGYGRGPHYTNIRYPFPVNPPFPPVSDNECGSYVTTFKLPSDLVGHQLRLRFEGVDSSYHVWVNGNEIGYSQGSRNAAEFDVTHSVHSERENVLAVRVYQFCDGSYIEDQDQWWLSGIFRDVFLLGFPKDVCFQDIGLQTELDHDYRHAVLKVQVDVRGRGLVGLRLLDASSNEVAKVHQRANKDDSQTLNFTVLVSDPKKWTAETPHLYDLVLSIDDSQYVSTRVGFRQVEIKDGLFKVNGKRIVLKGANRHEHHPDFGRAVPLAFSRRDLALMKSHNINAIRTCHQPNDPRLYDLADEMGFWVMDEADLECHGFEMVADTALVDEASSVQNDALNNRKQPNRTALIAPGAERYTSDNPAWHDAYVDRAKNLVHRDKLHPCVIMWSLGNEAFYGRNHTAMAEWIHSFDPTRPLHYEPDYNSDFVDVYSRMYASVDSIISFAKDKNTKNKPLVLCEYIHAMGTGPGAIKEYIDAFYKYPRLQGGWVWEWANHGLRTATKDGTPYYGYGGDFGDVPNDYNFVMDGVLQSDHMPNSGLLEYKKALEPVQMTAFDDKHVTIINRLDFATLDHLAYLWSIVDESGVRWIQGMMTMPKGVKPGTTALLTLPNAISNLSGEAFFNLSIGLKEDASWANAGHQLAWAQIPLSPAARPAPTTPAGASLKVENTATTLIIGSASTRWTADLVRGNLTSWTKNGTEILADAMTLSFYRALTDNDRPQDGWEWKDRLLHLASLQTQLVTWQEAPHGEVQVSVEQKFAPPSLAWSIDLDVTYTFKPSGTVTVHVLGNPTGLHLPRTLPRIGFTLGLQPGFEQLTWFGRGPGESYRDMKLSQKIGRYEVKNIDDLWAAPEFPQECSNRTDTRWLDVSNGEIGLRAQICFPEKGDERGLFDFMASWYDVKDIDEAQHPYELERKRKEHVVLRLDAAHHGLGTGSCGPKTLEKYALKSEPFEFTFVLS